MFIKKDTNGNIIGFCSSIPQVEDKIVNKKMTFKDQSGWVESLDKIALDDFLKNGPAKTEAQLDNEDRSYYQLNTDPILIKALYAKAEELGLDLSEAITLKAARKAKRSN
tara:strand:- start:162 stop:491 length:330 start_codon:yes stop_codon:yes gene_type:complete